jgi:hypothetical protein
MLRSSGVLTVNWLIVEPVPIMWKTLQTGLILVCPAPGVAILLMSLMKVPSLEAKMRAIPGISLAL